MSVGISALTCRLDSDVPAASPGGIDWADFIAWNGGVRPAFAGKYLLGGPWRLVHGEATSLIDPLVPGVTLRIAPLQASDPFRQAQGGDLGEQWGSEDGDAIAKAIDAGRRVGDLVVSGAGPTYVYLEVAAGTALTPQYWAGWATAVGNAMFVGDKVVGSLVVPTIQPLLPCLATTFEAAATAGHWQLPAAVSSALDLAKTVGWQSSRCHGFWAVTTDPATITPAPAPNWPAFDAYAQPQTSGPATPVPVRIWRFATGTASAPVHQVGRLTLDATAAPTGQPDPVLDAMITVRAWRATPPATVPGAVGIDRGNPVGPFVAKVARLKLVVAELPAAVGVAIPPLKAQPSFVIRYYSGVAANGVAARSGVKDLTRPEAKSLASKVDVVAAWQARVTYGAATQAHLSDPANGQVDGEAAGWFAAHVIGQTPHTPIYFAVDSDVNTAGRSTQEGPLGEKAITDAQLIAYFTGVAAGMRAYLASPFTTTPTPYPIGIYGCARACRLLYENGLATHFWQAIPSFWGDEFGAVTPDVNLNRIAFPHANIWQVVHASSIDSVAQAGLGRLFPLKFGFNDKAGPAQLDLTVGGVTKRLAFPPTIAQYSTAVGGSDATVSTEMSPQGRLTWMTALVGDIPRVGGVPTLPTVAAVGGAPAADFACSFAPLEAIGDLDISWGDTGGWRASAGGL